jgi:chitodextrinase
MPKLNWSASSDNIGVASYRIRRNGDIIGTVQTLGFHDTGLAVNTVYNYEVTALDQAGNISPAALLTIGTLPDISPPSLPENLVATPDVTTVLLTWSASTDNIAVAFYRILRGGFDIATVQGLSYLDTGLAPGSANDYQIIAVDSSGNLSPAALSTVTTLVDLSPPSTPGNLTADLGQFTVLLTWAASTDNAGGIFLSVRMLEFRRSG